MLAGINYVLGAEGRTTMLASGTIVSFFICESGPVNLGDVRLPAMGHTSESQAQSELTPETGLLTLLLALLCQT